jgi:fatty acid synthase subunit beta, fungi type
MHSGREHSGSLTGATTPRSGASPRPFVLSYVPHYEHTFLIPTSSFLNANQLKDQFLATLPSPSADNPNEFESTAELVARFMGFVAEKFENENEGEDVLLLVVAEFETRFLRGNEVHGMVSDIDGDIEKKKGIYLSLLLINSNESYRQSILCIPYSHWS